MIFRYPFRRPVAESSRISVRIPRCQPHTTFPIIIDVTMNAPEAGGNLETLRYSIDIDRRGAGSTDSQLHASFALQTTYSIPSSFHPLPFFDDRSPMGLGYSSTDVRIRDTPVPLLCVLSVIPADSCGSGRVTGKHAALTILHTNLEDPIEACTLCSASGRSVYVVKRKRDGKNRQEVFVVDYLSS